MRTLAGVFFFIYFLLASQAGGGGTLFPYSVPVHDRRILLPPAGPTGSPFPAQLKPSQLW